MYIVGRGSLAKPSLPSHSTPPRSLPSQRQRHRVPLSFGSKKKRRRRRRPNGLKYETGPQREPGLRARNERRVAMPVLNANVYRCPYATGVA